ncbi:MAG: glycosyl hydrolase [Verrucomicrobiia bacterium]
MKIDLKLTPKALLPKISRFFELAGPKILQLDKAWTPSKGTAVFTVKGKYTSRSWTEWTQGFQFGSPLLLFDVTGDERLLEIGRSRTVEHMATHVSHIGVHDHGFNNISTYGNLLQLLRDGQSAGSDREIRFYELALKISGAIQAARWTRIADGSGFIYSFNGPHSLFIDTIRSLRSLAVAHQLGHTLMGERDAKISLLGRLVDHACNTARYSVYYGEGRDAYDICGRTAHESIFNINDGSFRCPNSQQGYSPFTTWTRGLAWGICGFAEQLEFHREFLAGLPKSEWPNSAAADASEFRKVLLRAAKATADFYTANTCADGIPMWDTGAPGLARLGDYLSKPSDPFNGCEPVDSSAAAIAAQGLIRLGNDLIAAGDKRNGRRYRQAGLTVASTLFDEPYLSLNPKHQGLILHSVYHRPNGWDYIAPGQKIANGESSMWGDYHAMELAVTIWREAQGRPAYAFYRCLECPHR